jgi:outer membrane protein assembly factor BamB
MKTQAISWMRGRAARYAGMVAGFSDWRSRSRVLMAAAAGMVLAAGVFASPAAASASTPSITLKPTSGPPTTKVSVTGAGFGTSETVTVTDFGMSQSAVTSSTGTFTASFTVPNTAPPGKYPVAATGQTSHLSATAYFLVRTNWPQLRFGATGTGYNPYENVLTPSNVGNLARAWVQPNGQLANTPPSVYNGVLYTSGAADLYAINPVTGAVLWTGTAGPSGSVQTPAVVNGVAYIASSDGNFYAYSAKASSTNCTGTPPNETCKPLWTAPIEGAGSDVQSSAVVSGGVVYVAAGYELYAFSAGGCRSATCNPLWVSAACSGCGGQSPVSGASTPAVVGGVVYAGGLDGLWAYSASGSNGCSGTPKTCSPLWHGSDATVAVSGPTSTTAVAVVNGMAYISADNDVYAFSTACPVGSICKPLWSYTASSGAGFSSPAVANGKIYVNATDATLYVFSASTGTPLWTAPAPDGYTGFGSAPAVADGVVYAGWRDDLEAFSASGTVNCSGTPLVCKPLWTLTGPNGFYGIWDAPVVANGVLYAAEGNGTPFSAYKLP